jgi:hypothetical protein
MVIWRVATLIAVGVFAFATPGSADSGSHIVTTGLCNCNVSTPGFSCHFQRWVEAPDYQRLTEACAAQSQNYGTLSRSYTYERRRKKRHD